MCKFQVAHNLLQEQRLGVPCNGSDVFPSETGVHSSTADIWCNPIYCGGGIGQLRLG